MIIIGDYFVHSFSSIVWFAPFLRQLAALRMRSMSVDGIGFDCNRLSAIMSSRDNTRKEQKMNNLIGLTW